MTQAATASITNPAITVSAIRLINGEPRMLDLDIAKSLGFVNPHQIRPLIKRHLSGLNAFGSVSPTWEKPSSKGGRPSHVFYLNEEQAIFITAKSDTPRAAEITVEMVRVFRAYLEEQRKPVEVRQHRRRAPEPKSVPLHFEPGSDFLRDLYTTVMNANLRVEEGQEPNFGKALESVFADLVTKASGGKPSGKYFGDYNWDRIKGVSNVDLSKARKVVPAH